MPRVSYVVSCACGCALWLLIAGCSGGDSVAQSRGETSAARPSAARPSDAPEAARPSDASAAARVATLLPKLRGAESASPGDPSFETVLAPVHDVEVCARLDGIVVALDVEEGRRVSPGARLAQLDDRDRRAALDESEALVARAAAGWERAQRLHEQKLIADEAYLMARSEWQVAVARRNRAHVEWEHCRVSAPIAGVIALRRAQVGQMVKSGDLLFRVSDPDRLRAELLLPESRFGTVHAGQAVTLVPAAGLPIAARVARVSPLVDPASGTFRVVIDVDNRRARLPSGVSARVDLEPTGITR